MTPMDDTERHRLFNTPAAAMCDDKIIKRWDRGGEAHWVVGSRRNIDGVDYKLLRIVSTAGLNYLVCERTRG